MDRTIGVAADPECDPRAVEDSDLPNATAAANCMRYPVFYQYWEIFSTGVHGLRMIASDLSILGDSIGAIAVP
jgi:hypothetical protein